MYLKLTHYSIIIGLVFALALLAIQSLFIPIGVLILLSVTIFIFSNLRKGILILFVTKPIIDATWAFEVVPGFTLLQVVGILFPLITLTYFLQYRQDIKSPIHSSLMYLFLISNIISALITIISNTELFSIINSSTIFLQISNLVAVYLLIPQLISNEVQFKRFIFLLLISGLFPIVTGLLQILGFLPTLKTLRTTGELIRISGWYYDSANMRFYAFQTLLAIVMYLTIHNHQKNIAKKLLLALYACFSIFVLYKTYSKSALVILGLSFIIYTFTTRKYLAGMLVIVTVTFFILTYKDVTQDIERLVWKEIKFIEDKETVYTNSLLSGRIGLWERMITQFSESDIVQQLFGYNYLIGRRAHNDFVRILIASGFIGLMIYIVILFTLGRSVLRSFIEHRDIISIAAIVVFIAFIIDSVGLTMTLQPGYCWVTFGIMSISINRYELLQNVRKLA